MTTQLETTSTPQEPRIESPLPLTRPREVVSSPLNPPQPAVIDESSRRMRGAMILLWVAVAVCLVVAVVVWFKLLSPLP